MKIRLDPEARERYGCAEWLDWDSTVLHVEEAEEIQERCGIGPNEWGAYLEAASARALRAVVWMCLTRAGHHVGWDDVRFNVLGVQIQDDKPASRGKGSRSTRPSRSAPAAKP